MGLLACLDRLVEKTHLGQHQTLAYVDLREFLRVIDCLDQFPCFVEASREPWKVDNRPQGNPKSQTSLDRQLGRFVILRKMNDRVDRGAVEADRLAPSPL